MRRLSEEYKIQMSGSRGSVESDRQSVAQKSYKETGFIHALAGVNSESLITEGQRPRLWATCTIVPRFANATHELKLSDEQIKSALKHFGFERMESITREKYEPLIEYLQSLVKTQILPKEPDLYPANNDIVKRVRALTKHEPHRILSQCRHYGYERPRMMPQDELSKLIVDMCADWAVGSGVIGDHQKAHTSIQGALAFAIAAGQPILGAAMEWLNRLELEVSA